jgi:hypothetical protein
MMTGEYSLVNSKAASPKKPYRKPTLRVYGDIKEVTKSTGNDPTAMSDGGFAHFFKTF